MSSDIDIKLELLKLEKENQEKLEKEGKEEKPSLSVSSFINPNNVFEYDQAQTVNTNFAIDGNIKMKVPPDPFVLIKNPPYTEVESVLKLNTSHNGKIFPIEFTCYVAPCAAFMRYIKSYPIVGTVEQTLEKKKGFTSRFDVSVEIKRNVSIGFKGCEASLEVTTGFDYGETVTSETTETWKQTLTEGKYVDVNHSNPGVNVKYIPELEVSVMFVPINHDPFTLRYQNATWDPVEYNPLIKHLAANPKKWISDRYFNFK
ncbi:hypothetical protein ACTFIY_008070 [Dictyostelium cf. discoideum]